MIKKIFLAIFAFCSFFSLGASSSIDEIQKTYKNPLSLVESLRLEHARNDYKAMVSLCSCFDKSLQDLIKQLRKDMRTVQLAIKKENADLQGLYNQLRDLCAYIKRHKNIYNAILVHNNISELYQSLFDMIDNNEDVIAYIDSNREFFGLKNIDSDYLHVFLKKIKIISHQISKFEDYVHSDYIDLKMQNYVFKIELIKLRNAILFDKRYKNQ